MCRPHAAARTASRFTLNLPICPLPAPNGWPRWMAGWDDASTGNWCATTDVVDGMLTIVNPDLTAEEINTYLGTLDFETLKSMMG